ncbi:UNVERIFIED_CONTAM: hypothetical protein Slati_0965400 [Sesamum latifolium]|uniref:Integrase catalytic domain-containing protein n=1 Tax=Sesamum latifolium TaxID=2727402 RepID=A0AAW2XQJ9_9LAMI
MSISRRRLARTQRNTRWMLWFPHWYLNAGQQNTTSWILLAYYEARCTLLGEQVRKMPKSMPLSYQPAEPLNVMLSPCPFSQWGMDIVGPFLLAPGQRKFLLIAIDYFTKRVEAEPLARITKGEVMKFIWKNIIWHFGLPRELISDNGRQFQGRRIQDWCAGLHIKQRFTSVSHPQANGTTPRGSTGESPFTLVYGTEAIIPAELGMPSHRILHFNEEHNSQLLKEHLDLVDELRRQHSSELREIKAQ